MAVALLTTFYGAVMANMFALPLAHKLKMRSANEVAEKSLVVQGLLSILAGESPRFLVDRLNAQLPPSDRLTEAGLILSGTSPDDALVEIVELADHPWFLGCQFHPEFKSRPTEPHPLFVAFIDATLRNSAQS
jgi:gamma-glutamyl-gamma-aminobutyrate hydrolase PuuD